RIAAELVIDPNSQHLFGKVVTDRAVGQRDRYRMIETGKKIFHLPRPVAVECTFQSSADRPAGYIARAVKMYSPRARLIIFDAGKGGSARKVDQVIVGRISDTASRRRKVRKLFRANRGTSEG